MTMDPPVPIEDIPDKYPGHHTMMVYGPGGVGKSEFGASTGKEGIVLSIGDGELTFSSPGFKKRNPVPPKIAYIREKIDPKTGIFKNPPEAFDKVGDFLDWFIQSDFKVLTIDDATTLNTFARNKAISISPDFTNAATNVFEKSKKYQFPIMEISDYGREMNMISWLFAQTFPQISDAGKSIIVLAHERLFYKAGPKIGDEKVIYRVTPGFTGQTFPDALVNMFDFVWHMSVTNGTVFRMRTMPTLLYAGKTRWSGVFKEQEETMTFLKMRERLLNS